MAVYNSAAGEHCDDSDITIIHRSILPEHGDEHATSAQRLGASADKKESNGARHDYVFVDHNPQENARELEQLLHGYIRDLKDQGQSQLDCARLLVVRVMDLIRPAYPTDQQKMIELDKIMSEIGSLHNERHVEQREKVEHLRNEICQLQKMLCATEDRTSIVPIEANRNYSLVNQTNSLVDTQQWTEIDDDTRRLQHIVQSQQDQINEIVSLISHAAVSSSMNADAIETPVQSSGGIIQDLLQRIKSVTHSNEQPTPVTTSLENHSPGTSPSQSLTTLISASLNHHVEAPTNEDTEVPLPPTSPLPPVVEPPAYETKTCPICNASFMLKSEADEMAIYDHIERCLFPVLPVTEPKSYVCPVCERKFPGDDELTYHQHLSDCINRDQFP